MPSIPATPTPPSAGPRQCGGWPASAHPFQVYIDTSNGHAYMRAGIVRCQATSPETALECAWSWVPWRPSLPGIAWLAIATGKDGVPVSASAGAGLALPANTRHARDRLNHDGTTTAGHAGLYHVEVAGFLGGPGTPIRQILFDNLDWTPPEPATLATVEDISFLDPDGRTVTLTIQAGRVVAATVTGP